MIFGLLRNFERGGARANQKKGLSLFLFFFVSKKKGLRKDLSTAHQL